MSGYRECHHTAMVAGTRTVFVSIEYEDGSPPKEIRIDGMTWTLQDGPPREDMRHST